MEHSNQHHIGDTIRIRRPPKVFTDILGRTTWMSDVEPLELELEIRAVTSTDPYDHRPSF